MILQGQQARRARKAIPERLGRKVSRVRLAQQDLREKKATLVIPVRKDPLAQPGLPDRRATLETQDLRVLTERMVR